MPVTIAVERDEQNRIGRIRLEIADRPGSAEMIEFPAEVPTAGSAAEDPDAVTSGAHLVASLLKRWIAGTLHHRVSLAHMPYYLDEFTFRFNRRKSKAPGLLFTGSYSKPWTPTPPTR